MAVGINNGLVGTPAESLTYDSNYPSEGSDNSSQQWHDNNTILQAQIENIQAKEIILSNDLSGSVLMDSGNDAVTLVATLSTAYLPTAGGSMNGAITLLADPTNPLEASTKQYVDNEIIAAVSSIGTIVGLDDKLDIAGGTMTGDINMGGNRITGLSGATPGASDAISRGYADSNYLSSTNANFSSNVTLTAIPTLPNHLTTKGYVDDAVTALVDTAPGALDTLNELAAAIGDDANFASTMTTNLAGKINKAGDTMTGQLILNADPTLSLGASTKQYVDNGLSLKSDTTHNHDSDYINTSGDTMTGALTLASDPALALEAATKQYVDAEISSVSGVTGLAAKVDKAGDTMTGALILASDPTANLEAATKQYVDNSGGGVHNHDTLYLSLTGGTLNGNLGLSDGFSIVSDTINANGFVTLASKGNGSVLIGSENTTVATLGSASQLFSDIDLKITTQGAGLILTEGGYDMSTAPAEALATKGYVDTEISTHNHDTAYSAITHNHDTAYSAITHNHDTSYLSLTGGTITGDTTFNANILLSDGFAIAPDSVNVDANLNLGIRGNGSVLINTLTTNTATVGSAGAATDIDLQFTTQGTGLIIAESGYNMSAGPAEALTTKGYVDTALAGKSDTTHNHDASYALATHNHDLNYASVSHNHDLTYVNSTGDTMTGALSFDGDPTITAASPQTLSLVGDIITLTPSTAGYVQILGTGNSIIEADPASTNLTLKGNSVLLEADALGGVFSNTALTLPGDPVNSLEAATKQYVDAAVSGGVTSLTASASLLYPTLASLASADLTITVTGAVIGNEVALGLPPTVISGLVFNAFVSAADTVTVRATNASGAPINPVVETFNVRVFQ